MTRLFTLGLLSFLTVSSSVSLTATLTQPAIPSPIAQTAPVTKPSSPKRDVFYMSDRFGFRFVSPAGYVVVPGTIKPAPTPPVPAQTLEIWKRADYLNRANLPESPPIIRITVYNNSRKLPLKNWKGELSRNDDRVVTVAGQAAIAYTSTGLYESDNVVFASPDGRHVFRLTVGYISANDNIRKTFQEVVSSFTFDLVPVGSSSKWRLNYDRLKTLLAAKNWQAADSETRAAFQRLQRLTNSNGYLYETDKLFNRIPCNDLNTIDALWSQASSGRFGYRSQQRIWQQTSRLGNSKARVDQFGQLVGWRNTQEQNNPDKGVLNTPWRLDYELNYTANAPVGQFPWAGISSHLLQDFLEESSLGCGSCTIDAIYLAGDRYYKYVPALFSRLKQCR